ncbi:RNA-guided endonuclease InsQ/TnpB family protein [Salinifilum ghardaiensis]
MLGRTGSGLAYGVIWWVLDGLLLMPAELGMPVLQMGTSAAQSLLGHLLYGIVTALVLYQASWESPALRGGSASAPAFLSDLIVTISAGRRCAMKANTARKYRLYPTREQADRLASWAHTCRAVWNTALAQRIWAYKSAQRVAVRATQQCAELSDARQECGWLRDLPAQSAQQVLRYLDAAYDNFFNSQHPAGFPQFKKKRDAPSVPFVGQAVQVRKVSRRTAQVKLPKLGWVTFRLSRPLGGTVRNATVSRDGLGWHVAFGVHIPEPVEQPVHTGPAVGIDVGISCSVFLSTEAAARQRPDTLTPGERQRLRGLERRKARQLAYAKKHNGGRYSNRLRKTSAQISAIAARQARRRADWNHKFTAEVANSHGTVAVEALKVSSMTRSARGTVDAPGSGVQQKAGLNRSITDQGWFEIRRQLGYKTRRHGGELIAVPAPGTSQTCNRCGARDPESREGCGRLFSCTQCGHTDHADRNAARTILDRALPTAGRAGAGVHGNVSAQSTRSPRQGRGTRTGGRLREPPPRSPQHDQEESPPSGR